MATRLAAEIGQFAQGANILWVLLLARSGSGPEILSNLEHQLARIVLQEQRGQSSFQHIAWKKAAAQR